jgi:hypothetical protein
MLPDWLMLAPNEDGDFHARMDSMACYSAIAAGTLSGGLENGLRQWVRNYKK